MASRTPDQGDTADERDRKRGAKREPAEPEEPAGILGMPLAKVSRTGSYAHSGVSSRSSAGTTRQTGVAAQKRKAAKIAVKAAHEEFLDPEAAYHKAVNGELKCGRLI